MSEFIVQESSLVSVADTIREEAGIEEGLSFPEGFNYAIRAIGKNRLNVATTAGTGAAYTATVDGIDALTAGATFIMIPHTVSTAVLPTLNVNGLGAKEIRRRVSNSTVNPVASVSTDWLGANKPIMVTYDGTYWIAYMDRPNANDIYGTVPISSGGTGVNTLEALKELLGIVSAEELVQQVITALGMPVFGRVDAENNIILTGELTAGTYTLKYEDGDGNVTTIGTLETQGAPKYTNQIPASINADMTPYNGGQGWKTNTRLNSSGAETEQANWEVTGFIPVTPASDVYLSGIDWNSSGENKDYLSVYDSSFTKIASERFPNWLLSIAEETDYKMDASGNPIYFNTYILTKGAFAAASRDNLVKMAYIRISAFEINDSSIITVDEPIE